MSECPYCPHAEDHHVPLDPQGSMTFPDPYVVACTDHYADPVTGVEEFCDCIWIKKEIDRDSLAPHWWFRLRAKYCEQIRGFDVQN